MNVWAEVESGRQGALRRRLTAGVKEDVMFYAVIELSHIKEISIFLRL